MTTQQQQASAAGVEVRQRRSAFAAELAETSIREAADRLVALLEAPPRWAARWQVSPALRCLPGVGGVRARAMIETTLANAHAGSYMLPVARLGELPADVRDALVDVISRYGNEASY